mmetsp:Transcript_29027/g.76567  ORF Transcript_29027/g.76567 Transcript_29027/m.76567 type:complete len:208 (+) Transcript_29027:383-1006(+)
MGRKIVSRGLGCVNVGGEAGSDGGRGSGATVSCRQTGLGAVEEASDVKSPPTIGSELLETSTGITEPIKDVRSRLSASTLEVAGAEDTEALPLQRRRFAVLVPVLGNSREGPVTTFKAPPRRSPSQRNMLTNLAVSSSGDRRRMLFGEVRIEVAAGETEAEFACTEESHFARGDESATGRGDPSSEGAAHAAASLKGGRPRGRPAPM